MPEAKRIRCNIRFRGIRQPLLLGTLLLAGLVVTVKVMVTQPFKNVIRADILVEEGFKMILFAGLVSPD